MFGSDARIIGTATMRVRPQMAVSGKRIIVVNMYYVGVPGATIRGALALRSDTISLQAFGTATSASALLATASYLSVFKDDLCINL